MLEEPRALADVHLALRLGQQRVHRFAGKGIQRMVGQAVKLGVRREDSALCVYLDKTIWHSVEGAGQQIQRGRCRIAVSARVRHGPARCPPKQ